MSYQKQKANLTHHNSQSDSGDSAQGSQIPHKKKRIQKEFGKDQDSNEVLYANLNKKKKQAAKEIKRIREQNRRANHKQYVTSLEEQIREKETQIQNLSARIKQLQRELEGKVCQKCRTDLTEVGINVSPLSLADPNFIEVEQSMGEVPRSLSQLDIEQQVQSLDFDDEFRRVDDDCSLRICFGNKNLFFFLVTMCCLTIGSIADNPEMFLQPIHPFMLKSQLCYLPTFEKLSSLLSTPKRLGFWDSFELKQFCQPPGLDENISRISDLFNIKIIVSRLIPKSFQFLPNLKDPSQMLLGMGIRQILALFIEGMNYYI